jgi:hypothetical protein
LRRRIAYAIPNNRNVKAMTKAAARWIVSNRPISVNTSLGVGQSPAVEGARWSASTERHKERTGNLMTRQKWTGRA